jgi:hypothetical protein
VVIRNTVLVGLGNKEAGVVGARRGSPFSVAQSR